MEHGAGERSTQPGFYFSKKLNLMVQIVGAGHSLPPSNDWEFLGSDIGITASEAMQKLLARHPEVDPSRLQYTTK